MGPKLIFALITHVFTFFAVQRHDFSYFSLDKLCCTDLDWICKRYPGIKIPYLITFVSICCIFLFNWTSVYQVIVYVSIAVRYKMAGERLKE